MTDEPKKPVKRTGKRRPSAVAREKEAKETVVQMFGRAPLVEEPRTDPDGIVPRREKGRSSIASVSQRFKDVQDKIDAGTITMAEFVAALTPEELVRGQLRAHDGTFKGRPPRWVPAEFYQACVRELLARGEKSWREAFLDSIKVFADIAKNEALEPKDRLKAAQYVIERVSGKVPDKVEVSVQDPWETLIGGIVAEAEDDAIANAARVLNPEAGSA